MILAEGFFSVFIALRIKRSASTTMLVHAYVRSSEKKRNGVPKKRLATKTTTVAAIA